MSKQLIVLIMSSGIALCYASENHELTTTSSKIGIFVFQNTRKHQEDRFYHGDVDGGKLYAIYDGHGGAEVSHFLAEKFHLYFSKTSGSMRERMVETFKRADENECIKKNKKAGSTASVVYVKDNKAHFAHVGDSRAVLEAEGDVFFATNDHKPMRYDEKKRIEDAGGMVFNKRVNGFLAISRALGDYDLDKKLIISEPEYTEIALTTQHKFLILATDGLWDTMNNEEVVALLKQHQSVQDVSLLAKMLVKSAVEKGSTDNITVMLVDLLS